jgi:hypothetical protein
MHSAIYPALFFSVAMLATTAYFLMGGLPLLILKHDAPVDARFIRSFFSVYYEGAFWTAAGASVSYALWGRFGFAIGAAAYALVVRVLRSRLIPAMEQIGAQIQTSPASAIQRFRRVHSAALLINLAQLIILVWSLTKLSL